MEGIQKCEIWRSGEFANGEFTYGELSDIYFTFADKCSTIAI